MKKVFLALPFLALLLLGAHFLRRGEPGYATMYAACALLLFTRRAWTRPALAGLLAHGFWLWLQTGSAFIRMRVFVDQPWTRLAAIMGAVMALTLFAAAFLQSRTARDYLNKGSHPVPLACVFLLSVGGLALARKMADLDVLLLDRFFPGWGGLEILFLGLYAVWIASLMFDLGKSPTIRTRIWALFSLAFFLQLALGLSGLEQFLMTGRLHLPVPALIVAGPVFRGHGFFMAILYGATIVLVGSAWCSHLCYIGAWDDRLSRLKSARPQATLKGTLAGRTATLALVLAVAAGLRLAGAATLYAVLLAAAFGLIGVGVMLFVSSRKGSMVHCAAYCPIGIIGNVLGKISPWRIRISKDCTRCGLCSRACRYGALPPSALERGKTGLSCTLCGDCLDACHGGHIGYHFPGLSRETARIAFLTLAVALHALFLGVARI